MIKLVATDLDGTLVRDGYHTLNPRANEVIIELKKSTSICNASGSVSKYEKLI